MKSDREAEIPYVTPYIWNLKRNDTNTLIYEIEANSENKLMGIREGCGGGIGGKFGIDMYTLLYLK